MSQQSPEYKPVSIKGRESEIGKAIPVDLTITDMQSRVAQEIQIITEFIQLTDNKFDEDVIRRVLKNVRKQLNISETYEFKIQTINDWRSFRLNPNRDKFDATGIAILCESEFGISITDDDIDFKMISLLDLIKLIHEKLQKKS